MSRAIRDIEFGIFLSIQVMNMFCDISNMVIHIFFQPPHGGCIFKGPMSKVVTLYIPGQ